MAQSENEKQLGRETTELADFTNSGEHLSPADLARVASKAQVVSLLAKDAAQKRR